MARVVKRGAAKRDLIAQWVWYAETADVEVADRFLAAAETTLNLLSTRPEIGKIVPVCKTKLQGMRGFPVKLNLVAGFTDEILYQDRNGMAGPLASWLAALVSGNFNACALYSINN
jgi:hypothetical protein